MGPGRGKPPLFVAPARAFETGSPPPCDRPATVEQAWAEALAALEVPASTRETWLDPVQLLGEANGVVCVAAEPRVADWVARRYGAALRRAVCDRGARDLRIFAT